MPSKPSVKQKIRNGEIVIGTYPGRTADRRRLEGLLNHYPYDFFSVDMQHSPLDEAALSEFCQVAAELETPVQLRTRHPRQAFLIGSILDWGLGGVEVPQIDSVETVREAVDAFYYPPTGGQRGWGGVKYSLGFTGGDGQPHSSQTKADYSEYWANTGVLMLQVESVESVINARQLCLPGVDCLSWGAHPDSNDLAFSREQHPEFPLKTDLECLAYVIDLVKDTHVKVCMRSGGQENRDMYLKMGCTVLMEAPGV